LFVHLRVEHWDVNNEQLHETWFDAKVGDRNLLSWIFKEFHRMCPSAKLFTNDFLVFADGRMTLVGYHDMFAQFGCTQRLILQAYKRQVQKLLKDNAPIYGVGLQSHFGQRVSREILMVCKSV
jgi:endo-1,4-beta-xylanase